MNPLPGKGKRLTWDPHWPMPYESGWSIFAKVLAYNDLPLADLARLIRRQDGVASHRALNLCDSSWIDFERFSELLGVDSARLQQGFWDRIGLPAATDRSYAIRHCPACWRLNFHCLLFDLSSVSTCPWHGAQLTEPCPTCATPQGMSSTVTTEFGAERGCPRCAAAFPNFAQLLAAEKPDAQFGRMVQEQCRKVIEWFAAAREKLPEGDVLLRECLRVGETKQEGDFTHRLAWPLARAQTILGELPPWALSESWGPVRHGQLRAVQRYDGEAEAELGEGAAGRLYRCIRRHIFRQYVRSHRDCLGTLRCCDREQSLSLNGAHVCTVSMAYLIWRMSVEGLANIEGLHYARKNPIYLRLMAPEGHASMPPLARAHWCYFGFFGIWEELTRLCSRLNFSVVQDSIPCSGHVLWKCAPVPRDYRSAHEEFDWHILYPDPEILTAMTHQRCLTIERSRILFGSIRPPWRQSPNGAPDGLRNLFKILHAEPMHSNEYRRLKV